MFALLTMLALGSTEPRLLVDEVAAEAGALGTAYETHGTRLGDVQLASRLGGRLVLRGLALEAGGLLVAPLSSDGVAFAVTAMLRVGWSGQRWSVVGGALLQWARDTTPAVQWLPTLRASVDLGPLGVTLGLFDDLGVTPAHLSVDLTTAGARFSVGWVAPIGLRAALDLPVSARLALRLGAVAFKLGGSEAACATIGLVFTEVRR